MTVMELLPSAGANGLDAFGQDPWWFILLKALLIFVILVLLTLFNIWWERRVVARMQHRIGPNVHGPFGLLQSLADGVKLALKEDIIPKAADKVVFLLAPVARSRGTLRRLWWLARSSMSSSLAGPSEVLPAGVSDTPLGLPPRPLVHTSRGACAIRAARGSPRAATGLAV